MINEFELPEVSIILLLLFYTLYLKLEKIFKSGTRKNIYN